MSEMQRRHDADLVRSLRNLALWIGKNSRKAALMLEMAADRIEQLGGLDPSPGPAQEPSNQPASTPIN